MNIILMGPQGSGKGTQAERIIPKHHLVAVATGELFRKAVSEGTPLGIEAKRIMDRGELVPDDITCGLVEEKLDEISDRRSRGEKVNGVLFDGFPRTAAQAGRLDVALTGRGQKIDAVVLIDVPREDLVARLSGRRTCSGCNAVYHVLFNPPKVEGVCDACGGALVQRADDTPDAIAKRLDAYFSSTAPLIDFYDARGVVHRIDGNKPIDQVTDAIEAVISTTR